MVIKFKITNDREGSLSKDIEKMIKKERCNKTDKQQNLKNKGKNDF